MRYLLTLLVLLPSLATADEISITRVGQYDWHCADQAGTTLSGHTRQDKAIQACANRSLADGLEYRVIPGEYRVQAEIGQAPPVVPPVDPPVDPPPIDQPVTFGPVQAPTEYPNSISALSLDAFRWELTFTLDSVAGIQGLASRDESGQADPGHLSVWVQDGALTVRHQGTDLEAVIVAGTPIIAGQEYQATISVNPGAGMGLFLDGNLEGQDPFSVGTAGNSLPLWLGARCSRCNDGTHGPEHPIDGSVSLAIFEAPLELPAPVAFELQWTAPTEYEDGTLIGAGELAGYNLYQTSPGARKLLIRLEADETGYEVTGLPPGTHCFVGTALTADAESQDSNQACKEPT